ncbi:MAG: Gfo/Idh/MocA family oxidoreductase [Verrucomicrobia bacterium]|nr:Gfo/Idh/MocA family oxidoreductase [Verrucomicrobiota bacterium]
MNFIVAGVGFWGRKWIELLQEHPRASVAAAVEKNQLAAEWPQQTYNIPCFPELSTAAAKVSADAVLVVTNPSQHKPVILQAVGLGKHVLIEKPMVTSMAEAAEVAAAAEHASGLIMVAQGYRFVKAAALVRERLVASDIGDLQAIKIRFRRHLPDVITNPEHSIFALPHSILLDMSVHHIDLLRFMTQREVTSVLAVEHDTPDNAFKHPSNALSLMRLQGDIPVIWDGDWCARGPITSWEGEWHFVGSKGRLFWDGVIDDVCRTSVRLEIPAEPTKELMPVEPVQERRVPLLEHFIDSIERAEQPQPSVADNQKTLAVVFASIESVVKKREVKLV